MSLPLDATQRALLEEMGIWWPPLPDASRGTATALPVPSAPRRPVEPPTPSRPPLAQQVATTSLPVAEGGSPSARAPASDRSAQRSTVLAPATPSPASQAMGAKVADPGWAGWVHLVAQCQSCALHATRGQGVLRPDVPPAQADWLVVLDPPQAAEDLERSPVVGDSARLLDAMLRAVGVHRGGAGAQGAYVTTVLKCRLPPAHAVQAQELDQCQQHLQSEIERLRPKVLLLMGRFAAQLVPQPPQTPLERLRAQVHTLHGVPTVVSYPPSALLRNPRFKGRAWSDLCLAADVAQGA